MDATAQKIYDEMVKFRAQLKVQISNAEHAGCTHLADELRQRVAGTDVCIEIAENHDRI